MLNLYNLTRACGHLLTYLDQKVYPLNSAVRTETWHDKF